MKAVHFPGGNDRGQPSGGPVTQVARTRQGGKCPDSPWKRFTSPMGMPENIRLESLWPRLRGPAQWKVSGFPVEAVHFPSGNTREWPPGEPVATVARTPQGESARIPRGSGSLSRRESQRIAAWRACGHGCTDTPGEKCPDSPWKRFTFHREENNFTFWGMKIEIHVVYLLTLNF